MGVVDDYFGLFMLWKRSCVVYSQCPRWLREGVGVVTLLFYVND